MTLRNKQKDFFICLGSGILLGLVLWLISSSPPYSHPIFEFNMNYWGLLKSIAHKWRELNFDFWDREVGGGTSLFLSGQYPLFGISHAVALFLNDDHVLLFNMIIPYVVGAFFSSLLLRNEFKLKWPYVFFGTFFYLSIPFGKHVVLASQPIFLWGPALLPAMVYFYLKFKDTNPYFGAALIGSLIAFQFSQAGGAQFLQQIIWWFFYWCIDFLIKIRKENFQRNLKVFSLCSLITALMAIGMFATQIIPTIHFIIHDSSRLPGHYQLNSFPLTSSAQNAPNGPLQDSVLEIFRRVIAENSTSSKGILAILVATLGYAFARGKNIFGGIPHKNFLIVSWLSTLLFLLFPTLINFLSIHFPFTSRLLTFFTLFNFKYGMYIFDFFFALTWVLIIRDANSDFSFRGLKFWRKMGVLSFFSLSLELAFIPLILLIPFFKNFLKYFQPYWLTFVPQSLLSALVILVLIVIVITQLFGGLRHRALWLMFVIAFPLLGFTRTINTYFWDDKGRQATRSEFEFDAPEMQFYRNAQGKFYLPYDEPFLMSNNYDLIYGIRGISGYMSIAALRLNRFISRYHVSEPDPKEMLHYKLLIPNPSEVITSYFPVDFTTIEKNKELPWKNFVKKVTGNKYDIWVREQENNQVLFANSLECASLSHIVKQFETVPFTDALFVEEKDCQDFKLRRVLPPNINYEPSSHFGFSQKKGDHIFFGVSGTSEIFATIPQMYQTGWRGYIDGKETRVFPANYLFIGLRVPAGKHFIILKFIPPGLKLGFLINVLCLILLFSCKTNIRFLKEI